MSVLAGYGRFKSLVFRNKKEKPEKQKPFGFLAEDKGFEFTRISNILFQLLSLSAILSRSMYYRHSFVRNNFVH